MSEKVKMGKGDLVKALAKACDVSQNKAAEMVGILGEMMVNAVDAGMPVVVPGLGTIKPVARKARRGRNPKTGEAVEIAAKTALKFKPSQYLKERLLEARESPLARD